jgi:DNA-binding PadR family transcriptional regulator
MTEGELAILGLVIERPRHASEIEPVIKYSGMREWTAIGFSLIDYLLKKLESSAWVESRLAMVSGAGSTHRVYSPTQMGALKWLR